MTPNSDGYDISHWNTITGPTPRFRILAHKATEGTARDPMFIDRWNMFRSQGTEIMCPYHFLRSTSTISKQLDNYTAVLAETGALKPNGLVEGVLLMTDWEPLTNAGVLIDPVPVDVALEWLDAVKGRFGEREITYSSDWKADFLAWRQALPDHPLWYANYHLEGPHGFWAECAQHRALIGQWTDDARVAGFADGIDMSHVFDWAAVRRLAGYPQPQPPTEDTMTLIDNQEVHNIDGQDWAPNAIKWAMMPDGTKRHVKPAEYLALGNPTSRPVDNATLDGLPDYVPPLTSVALQGTLGVSGVLNSTFR